MPHGYGLWVKSSKQLIECYSKQSKREGFGLKVFLRAGHPQVLTYEGQFKEGHEDGWGKYQFSEEAWYEGQMKKGKADGFGMFFYNQNHWFKGEFKQDQRNGAGIMLQDDLKSVGFWKDN